MELGLVPVRVRADYSQGLALLGATSGTRATEEKG